MSRVITRTYSKNEKVKKIAKNVKMSIFNQKKEVTKQINKNKMCKKQLPA
jgi:hypothetical protein